MLVGGSAWSAYRYVRDRAGIDRVICNVLLTAGALIIAVGFSAAKTVGIANLDVLGVYETAGIAIMFGGFLALGKVGVRARSPSGPATATTGIVSGMLAAADAATWRERDAELISPAYHRYSDLVVESAKGAHLHTVDGRDVLDFGCGIGVTNLGHRHPAVVAAVHEQVDCSGTPRSPHFTPR